MTQRDVEPHLCKSCEGRRIANDLQEEIEAEAKMVADWPGKRADEDEDEAERLKVDEDPSPTTNNGGE